MSRRLCKCKIAKVNVSGTQASFFFFLPFDLTKISDFCIERD